MLRKGSIGVVCLVAAFFVAATPATVRAVTTTSPSYEASETEFGAGAALETCSGQYCAQATIGATGGEASSPSYTAAFSTFDEDDEEPVLEIIIEPGEANLGRLATDRTATRTMLLHVRSHFGGGYIVQVIGSPPSYNGYTLAVPLEPVASIQGTEQFGINAVANATPTIGGDPVSTINDEPVLGTVVPRYSTPNLFTYTNGDIVARSTSESSQIRYTISMIVNVAGTTPAGHYSGDFSAIVTPDF